MRAVLDLSAVLARSGVRVTLLTGDASGAPDDWRGDHDGGERPRVVEINRALSPWSRSAVDRCVMSEAIADADIVHLHTLWDPFNRIVSAAAARVEKPYVITAHGMLDDHCMDAKPTKKRAYLALGGRRWIERAARVHFTASGERDQSLRRAPAMRPVVLPLVVDLPPLASLPGPEAAHAAAPSAFASREPVVLFLGRLHPIKGLDGLLEAFASVTAEGVAAQLLLVGPSEDGYATRLADLAERLAVRDRVHFVGMVGGEVKHSLYQAASLYALPSRHENFGLALVEAMACGAPTLTTRAVNIWPEVQRYGATIVDGTVDGLAEGLRACLGDLEDARRRAIEGRGALREWLDPTSLGRQYAELYREIVAEGAAS